MMHRKPYCHSISKHTVCIAVQLLLLFLSACGGSSSGDNNSNSISGDSDPVNGQPPTSVQSDSMQALTAASCANVIESGGFATPTTLFNTGSACDYYVADYASFSSSLVIEPGTVIMMGNDAEFGVREGSITAVGTAEQPITFIGEDGLQGNWQGIYLSDLRPSRMEHVDIRDGGNTSPVLEEWEAGLVVQRSTISLLDVSVSNSFVVGARIDGDSTLTEFARNRFYGNALEGLVASSLHIGNLDAESDYLGIELPNGNPYVKVRYNGNITANQDGWKKLNAPYRARTIIVSNDHELLIEAGTELQIESDIWAYQEGRFTAQGTAENPVLIRQPPGTTDVWTGIHADGGLITLDHTIVEGAKNGLFINADGIARVSNSLFRNNEEWGIGCRDLVILGELPVLELSTNVTFENNGLGDIDPDCPN